MAFYLIEPSIEDKIVAYLKQVAYYVDRSSGGKVDRNLTKYELFEKALNETMTDDEIINARKQWQEANKDMFVRKKRKKKSV